MRRITREVIHLAGVIGQINQRLALLPVGVDAILVTIGANHATFRHRHTAVKGRGLRHVILNHDVIAPTRHRFTQGERAQASTCQVSRLN